MSDANSVISRLRDTSAPYDTMTETMREAADVLERVEAWCRKRFAETDEVLARPDRYRRGDVERAKRQEAVTKQVAAILKGEKP